MRIVCFLKDGTCEPACAQHKMLQGKGSENGTQRDKREMGGRHPMGAEERWGEVKDAHESPNSGALLGTTNLSSMARAVRSLKMHGVSNSGSSSLESRPACSGLLLAPAYRLDSCLPPWPWALSYQTLKNSPFPPVCLSPFSTTRTQDSEFSSLPGSQPHFPLCFFPLGPTSQCPIGALPGFLLKPADPCQTRLISPLVSGLHPPWEAPSASILGGAAQAPTQGTIRPHGVFAFRKGHIFFETSYFHLWSSH